MKSEKEYENFYKHFWDRAGTIPLFDVGHIIRRKEITSNIPKNVVRILSIGSGFGEELLDIKTKNKKIEIYCVDISNEALKKCKELLNAKIYKCDATKLPFKDNYFDLVTILEVIEHIPNDNKVINEIYRVLKFDGSVIASTPSGKLTKKWKKHGHLRHYSRNKFIDLFESQGLLFKKDLNYHERTRLLYRPIKHIMIKIDKFLNIFSMTKKEFTHRKYYKKIIKPIILNIASIESKLKPIRIIEKKNFSIFKKSKRKRKLKILLFHNELTPYRIPLFNELSKKYDLKVLFSDYKNKKRKWKVNKNKIKIKYNILNNFKIGPFIINPRIHKAVTKESYDAYIVGENPSNIIATYNIYQISKKSRKKFILWSGIIKSKYDRSKEYIGFKRILFKLFESFCAKYRKDIYNKADYIIAYSKSTKNYLINLGVNPKRIFIGGQIMPEILLNKPEKRELINKKRVILSLGYLEKRKGIQYLIRAFKKIENKNIILNIAGSGSYEKELRKIAKGIENINFIGYKEGKDKAKVYQESDIFVLPTLHDPWGLVVNEAMYYGLPIITTKDAGASNMIIKAKNGLVVDSGNKEELYKAIVKIIKNQKIYESYSKKSSEYKNAWSVKEGMKPFNEIIEKVK